MRLYKSLRDPITISTASPKAINTEMFLKLLIHHLWSSRDNRR